MAGVLVIRALLVVALLAGCAHGPAQRCEIDHLPQADQGRAVEVTSALMASPTWVADLTALSETLGRSKVDCIVTADVEALQQVANRSTSDSFVVEAHLALGIQRGQAWLKAKGTHVDACAGR